VLALALLPASPVLGEPPSKAISKAIETPLAVAPTPLDDAELAAVRGREKVSPESPGAERRVILWDERLLQESGQTSGAGPSVLRTKGRFSAAN
jgi:hypothetical protein